MTANADLMDEAIRLGLILDRLALSSFGRVQEKIRQLTEDLAALVVRVDPTEAVRETTRENRLEELVQRMDRVIEEAFRAMEAEVNQDLSNAAALTQDSLATTLGLLLLIKGLSRKLDQATLDQAMEEVSIEGAGVSDWWGRQIYDIQFKMRRSLDSALRLTQIGREPVTGDLVNAVRRTGPGSLFAAVPRNTYGLIRSAYHAVANWVRFQIVSRHAELFRAYMHISVLDGRTSGYCRERAGRLWTLMGEPIGHRLEFLRCPIHWNCRSHLIAVLHAFEDLPGRIQRRIRREDFDGNPAREPSIKDWLDQRGETLSGDPLDYDDARRQLGL